MSNSIIDSVPISSEVAAVSCGLYKNQAILDLDYAEDSNAEADANFVMTGKGEIVEIQGTAESSPFSKEQFSQLFSLAESGISSLIDQQRLILAKGVL